MQDKKTLVAIIILLCIFIPLSIFSTYKHISDKKEPELIDDNPNKEFILNNKLYFYLDGKLITTYDCTNCTRAEVTIDDTNYNTNSYQSGSKALNPTINQNIGIFAKNGSSMLLNLLNGKLIDSFPTMEKIKNYSVDATSQFLIYENNNLWGVVHLDFSASNINNEYNYIALPSHFINNKLDTSKFIARKNLSWYILNADGSLAHSPVRAEITDFNDTYYVIYENGYRIFDYNNNEYLTGISKKNVYGVGKYMFIITQNNELMVFESCNASPLERETLPNYQELYFSQNDNGIDIVLDQKVYKTLALS